LRSQFRKEQSSQTAKIDLLRHPTELARKWLRAMLKRETIMLLRFFFRRLSIATQVKFMKRRGIVLGTLNKNGRQTYLYMLHNLFAEIVYENDNPHMRVETLIVLHGLNNHTGNYKNTCGKKDGRLMQGINK
jgi:hypothetical protein